MKDDIIKGIRTVTKVWKSAKRKADKEDRLSQQQYDKMYETGGKLSIRDAAFAVMEEAYNKVSSNGKFYANARQIMYAARPFILEATEKTELDDRYFTQTLLKDYIEENDPDWLIAWDARGHLYEPHTNHEIGLGGIEVKRYVESWQSRIYIDRPNVELTNIYTKGPENRFKNVLFIEKEGFTEILTHAQIPKRFDIALMSTKGIPVKAACDLINAMENENVKVFVLHDFDKDGFKIMKSLREGVRLSEGSDVIDLGLRFEDITDLQSEPVTYAQTKDPGIYLEECGATPEEIKFLVSDDLKRGKHHGRRVEINAMTSEQLILWLEKKFSEHGIEKYIPDQQTLEMTFRRAKFLHVVQKTIDAIALPKNDDPVPANILEDVKDILKDDPQLSWDEAIWRLYEGGGPRDWDKIPTAPKKMVRTKFNGISG